MKISRENLAEHLFEKMIEIIGKTVQDAINDKNWRNEWTMTHEQYIVFEKYSIPLIKRVLKCSKAKAIKAFDWYRLSFGISII